MALSETNNQPVTLNCHNKQISAGLPYLVATALVSGVPRFNATIQQSSIMQQNRILSQRLCLVMNPRLQTGMDAAFHDNINGAAEQVFDILRETGLIEQASAWFDIDEEIDIALGACFTPNDGTKQLYPTNPVSFADSVDRIPMTTKLFECVHSRNLWLLHTVPEHG